MTSNNYYLLNEKLVSIYHLSIEDSEKISQFIKTNISDDLMKNFLTFLSTYIELIPPEKQQFSFLGDEDAIKKADKYHKVIFENYTLRILGVIVPKGNTVPFHTHQWDSIAITTQGSKFKILDRFNKSIEEEWPVIVEKLQGSFDAYSYTNIGSETFKAILFEVKK